MNRLYLACFFVVFNFYNSINLAKAAEQKILSEEIQNRFNEIRLRMCYHDPKGVPRLEPLIHNDRIPIDIDHEAGRFLGHMGEMTIVGLSNFTVTEANLGDSRLALRLNFPAVRISGKYSLTGNFGGLIDLDGDDNFDIKLSGLNVKATGHFNLNKQVPFEDLKVDLKIASVKSNIDGLSDDMEVNDVLNEAISDLLPKYFEKYDSLLKESSLERALENALISASRETTVTLLSYILGNKSALSPLDQASACKV